MPQTNRPRPKSRLISIGLQNFQSFADYQEIPIAPLTFLYGPNSSGKSALIDALNLLEFYWGPEAEESGPFLPIDVQNNRLPRHWRRISGDEPVQGEVIFTATVDAHESFIRSTTSYSFGRGLLGDKVDAGDIANCLDAGGRVEVKATIAFLPTRDKEPHFRPMLRLSLEVAGLPCVRLVENKGFDLYLAHPLFRGLAKKLPAAMNLAVTDNTPFSVIDNWLVFSGDIVFDMSSPRLLDINLLVDPQDPDYPAHLEDYSEALEGAASVYNSVVEPLSTAVYEALGGARVPASRVVPSRAATTYHFPPFVDVWANEWLEDVLLARAVALNDGDPLYRSLAAACAVEYQSTLGQSFGTEGSVRFLPFLPSKSTLSLVNQSLRDHMFVDRAYQLTAKVTVLVEGEAFVAGVRGGFQDESYGRDCSLLVSLALTDPSGRRFWLDEVGSGIGYVLPVLMAAHSSGQGVIEQPELHLHPALQAALGDVFVDGLSGGALLIVESHSEHVLLRVLRRIRQTTSEMPIAESLRLAPDDVSVLYFDPIPDGSTKVRRLRVTGDGDFMDRWPAGFFAERDQELFDE